RFGQGFAPFVEVSAAAREVAAKIRNRGGGLSGIATKFTGLDAKLGGLQPSDLIVLAGRPSMGKTALVPNIAFYLAWADHQSGGEDGAVVGFFSLEMSDEQLATRIQCAQAGIPSEKIRRGTTTDAEWERYLKVEAELGAIPLHIDQAGGLSIAQLSARAR